MAPENGNTAGVARVLVNRSVRLRRGENVVIETWNHTLPWATACVVEARRIGARPVLLLEDESAYWRSLDSAPHVRRWKGVGSHEWALLSKASAYIFFPGPADRPRFRALPPETSAQLLDYNEEWYRRADRSRVRGVRCVLGYASDPQASHWGVVAPTWRNQILRGILEPSWDQIGRDARKVAERLRKGKSLRITAANGTDVTLRLRHRTPHVDDGVVGPDDLKAGRNVTSAPPGQVVVAVDEHSAEGVAVANRASFLPAGRAEGGQWELKRGKLENYWYTDGQRAFETEYERAPKGRDVLGIFSLGLNPSIGPGVPQVEDQEAGTVTLAVGGNTSYGGSNRIPFLSWIAIGEATVAVDGFPLCDRGKLL